MSMMRLMLAAAVVSAVPAISHAALVLQAVDAPRLINFDAVVDDTSIGGTRVYGYHATATYGAVSEGSVSNTGTAGFRSPGVSVRGSGLDLGSGSGAWTAFSPNVNTDADANDNITVSGMTIARGTATGMTNGVVGVAPLGEGNSAFIFGQTNGAPYRDNGFTLAISNGTGSAIDQVRVQMNTWYGDPDTSFANLQLSYSTDNTTYTPLLTLNGARTTTEAYSVANLAHWSALQPIDTTITFASPLAANGLAYLRIESLRVGGSGSGGNWIVDDLSLTATVVPEPTTLAGLLTGSMLLLRRRKH